MQLDSVFDCRKLFKEHEWESTPLGALENWPVQLKTLADFMLGSPHPIMIAWGEELITLYNDGYAQICGQRHPASFALPHKEIWHDVWDYVGPIIKNAYNGEGTAVDDVQLLMYRNGYPEEAHFSFSYTPIRDETGAVRGIFCACTETTAKAIAEKAEAADHDRLRQIFELSHDGIAMLRGAFHVFAYANSEYRSIIGLGREIIGKTVVEAVPEAVRQGFIGILDNVFKTGETFVARDLPIQLNRGSSGEMQSRVIDLVYQAMRDDKGRIEGILVQVRDVTEANAEKQYQKMLSQELGHRLKNQLAMVQAIVSQTLRNAADVKTARLQVGQRIRVLSNAHDLILEGGLASSTVADIVAVTLALHNNPDQTRIRFTGPRLVIGTRPSLSLSLILHELATNAIKHGSLSNEQGTVELSWQVAGEFHDRFEIVWTERGGPTISKPLNEGTGTRLIKAGLLGTTDCRVQIDPDPEGIVFSLSAELAGFQREH